MITLTRKEVLRKYPITKSFNEPMAIAFGILSMVIASNYIGIDIENTDNYKYALWKEQRFNDWNTI